MTDVIAVSFANKETAELALSKLAARQQQHLLRLADAVIVTKDADGKVSLKQTMNMTAAGAVSGGLWGTLIGLLFLNPLVGLAAGAAGGALAGSLTDYGINDQFMKDLGEQLQPGSSALFIMVSTSATDKVMPELGALGGKVFSTSLSAEDERKLRQALEGEVRRRIDAGEPIVDERIRADQRVA